jgi:hypothetical protein
LKRYLRHVLSYYRARYYDPWVGRFLTEDPLGFVVGQNFYTYVSNTPIEWADPSGLSAQDVQRIMDNCKKCTKRLTDNGLRYDANGPIGGWWNNLWSWVTKWEGCWDQAESTVPCLKYPLVPYDSKWDFHDVPLHWGLHHVVKGTSSDPNDPVVYCDPWQNKSWTGPKTTSGAGRKW